MIEGVDKQIVVKDSNPNSHLTSNESILFNTKNIFEVILFENICYCKADGSYIQKPGNLTTFSRTKLTTSELLIF